MMKFFKSMFTREPPQEAARKPGRTFMNGLPKEVHQAAGKPEFMAELGKDTLRQHYAELSKTVERRMGSIPAAEQARMLRHMAERVEKAPPPMSALERRLAIIAAKERANTDPTPKEPQLTQRRRMKH